MGVWKTLGEFTLPLLQFYLSFNISYIEIVAHLDLSQSLVINWYLQKILVNAKCIFHPQGVEVWNLGILWVSFYRIRKIVGFFLEARSNSKVSLIKTKCDTYHGKNNCGNNGYWLLRAKVSLTYSGLKVLEIIIYWS